jgi:hypothetical protein
MLTRCDATPCRRLQADSERLEDAMLSSLSKEEGAVLSDALANELGDHLLRMDEILTSLEDIDRHNTDLGKVEAVYMEAANYGNLLYQVVQRLQQLRPIYTFASSVFLDSVAAGIQKVSDSLPPISRQDIFVKKEPADPLAVRKGQQQEAAIAAGPSPGQLEDEGCET